MSESKLALSIKERKEIAGIIDADEEQAKKFETPNGKNKAPIDIECE